MAFVRYSRFLRLGRAIAMSSSLEPSNGDARVVTCELCIVGAGIAGLNALFAAREIFERHDRDNEGKLPEGTRVAEEARAA